MSEKIEWMAYPRCIWNLDAFEDLWMMHLLSAKLHWALVDWQDEDFGGKTQRRCFGQ